MASAKHEPITGGLGRNPQRVPGGGAKTMVRGQGRRQELMEGVFVLFSFLSPILLRPSQ